MKRIKFSFSEATLDKLEKSAARVGVSKSIYLTKLIQNDSGDLSVIKRNKLVEAISNVDIDLRSLVMRPELSANDKLKIIEYAKDIKGLLKDCT